MSNLSRPFSNLPPEQEAIRAKCFHPSGRFVEFPLDEVETSIPDRFEKIVWMYPDRLAVKMGDLALTYDELNKAANRVAWAIVEKGDPESQPVILLVEHGIRAIIACLGILKAGKVMVALDPSFPPERVALMLENCQAKTILTDHKNLSFGTNVAKNGWQVIITDGLENACSESKLGLHIPPDAPAQIVYTSGSTGQPKGILRTHRSLLHTARVLINSGHISAADRLLLLYHLSFGAGIGDIIKGLLGGAALFPFDVKVQGLAGLADLIVETGITYYSSSPSTFRYFIQALTGEQILPTVRIVELGSEPLSPSDVELYRKHFSEICLLLNRFASSETGILCLYFMNKQTPITTAIVPVGYPVEGREILLLGEDGKEVAFDQVGEIAVRSRHLSTEYWRNPELTKATFLPDPKGGGSRVYLTGDLGRMLPDGCLIYLGRKDLEVKLRGFRVAPIEIEMALLEHPQTEDAAVAAWVREPQETQLVAYVVPRQGSTATASELCQFLRSKLPDFMIPSAVMFLEALPLTNGKLDRKALPKPDGNRPPLRELYVHAQNKLEQELVTIWQDVLDVRPIGIHDNFFDLGGHSLAATRVVSQVIKTFQLDIPLQSLFAAPTVAEMAAVIADHQGKKLGEKALESILDELESLSDLEAMRLLADQNEKCHKIDRDE